MKIIEPLVRTLLAATALFGLADALHADPVKIRTSYVVPVNWPALLLEKKDLATHLGKSYTLEVVRFNGTPPMVTALASGDIDIGDLAYSSFALAVENAGMSDLVVIGDDFQDGVPGYYSNEFFVLNDGPIKTVEDLKGKVVATNATGSAVDLASRAMLRKHGLEPNRDYTIIESGLPSARPMLAEKKVDLAPGVLPFSKDPELGKVGRVLFTQKEAIGKTQMIVWAAHKDFIAKNRAAMLDMMEDSMRIVRWYLDPANRKEAAAIVAKLTRQPPDRYESWIFSDKDYYRDPNLLPDLDALQANIDLQKSLGFLKTGFDVHKQADLSLAREAAQRLK